MNRFNMVLAGLAGPVIAASLAGCGTGQIAQTTSQVSAVNGAEKTVGDVALRNVHIQALQAGDAIPSGSTVDLAFVASNQSLSTSDELTEISTEIGKVSATGAKKLPVGGALIVAPPATRDAVSPASLKELRAIEDANTATATLTLSQPISNGLTYEITFHFKQAGPISLDVPISAEGAEPAVPAKPHHH